MFGFAFKKDTSDARESPAITLVRNFVAERAQVAIYDPQVAEQQIWKELVNDGGDLKIIKDHVTIWDSAYKACTGADAVVIVTEWDEFSNKVDKTGIVATASPTTLQKISSDLLELDTTDIAQRSRSPALPSYRIDNQYKSIEERLDEHTHAVKVAGPVQRLDWARIAKHMLKPMYVFDGRGIMDAAKLEALGFRVEAIGHASSVPQHLYD